MRTSAPTGWRPERRLAGAMAEDASGARNAPRREWPLWEVFLRARSGLSHRHVGSVHAPDAEMAVRHARDTYTRRMEGVSLWVVRSNDITAADPDQAGQLYEPSGSKVYRHPTFYDLPDEVRHM